MKDGSSYVDVSRVTIREINKAVARSMIEKHHYTHNASSCRYALGIFYRMDGENSFFTEQEEKLIGCMTYGHPVSNRAIGSIGPELELDEVLELTRLFVHDGEYGKNIESYALAQSFKWLKENDPKVKVLISYSDPEVGHKGTIYQATNWLYQGIGQSKLMPDYSILVETPDGLAEGWVHSRTVGARWGQKNPKNLAKAIGYTFQRKEESSKHRYLYILAKGKERRHIIKNLKLKVMEYPNEQNVWVPRIERIVVENGEYVRKEKLQ